MPATATLAKSKEFYFDDQSWTVRYLIADTGGWLGGRTGSDFALRARPCSQNGKVIPVDLTKAQIENSPSLDTHKPVSRQYEIVYYSFLRLAGVLGRPIHGG